MENKNNSVPARDNEIEELAAGRDSATRRDSSKASLDKTRLEQEQEGIRVFTEKTEHQLDSDQQDGEILAANDSRTDSIAGVEEDSNLDIVMGTEADVTEEDLLILGDKDQDMDEGEDELLAKSSLDNTDLDGDPLNEGSSTLSATGDDLDTGDTDQNNPEDDAMGQGDEANSYYSLGDNDTTDESDSNNR